jgi:hypothetical protein
MMAITQAISEVMGDRLGQVEAASIQTRSGGMYGYQSHTMKAEGKSKAKSSKVQYAILRLQTILTVVSTNSSFCLSLLPCSPRVKTNALMMTTTMKTMEREKGRAERMASGAVVGTESGEKVTWEEKARVNLDPTAKDQMGNAPLPFPPQGNQPHSPRSNRPRSSPQTSQLHNQLHCPRSSQLHNQLHSPLC